MPSINIEHVTKIYGRSVKAVDDVSLTIEDGEFMVLVGPSGCGKSTLLRIIAGLEEITAGSIRIGERDVTALAPRQRDIAMVFQNYALYPHMSVRKNLGYGLKMRRTPRKEIDRRVNEVAKMLGLEELLDRRPAALSGGQRQRVAMGRAIVREPQAFLMDEPLSNLDAKLRVAMRAELARLHDRLGVTTVYVTHDQIEAMTLGHRVAVMKLGVIQQVDTPQELYRRPANVFVAAFMGSPPMNLVHARVTDGHVELGGSRIPCDDGNRPPDGDVVLGIRPEDLEDGDLADPQLPQIDVSVTVLEELGAESYAIFPIDGVPVRVDDSAVAVDDADESVLVADDTRLLFTARLDARSSARQGEQLKLAVDPARFHFFDPVTGAALFGSPGHGRSALVGSSA